MKKYEYIIAFVRPWDCDFFAELCLTIKAQPEFSHAKIKILTMWKIAYERLSKKLDDDVELVFLPTELEMTLTDADRIRVDELDNKLVAKTGTPIKVMLEAERFQPHGVDGLNFLYRHARTIEKHIPNNSLLFSNQIDHLCYWLACDIAKSRGGYFFGFTCPGRPFWGTTLLTDARNMCVIYEPNQSDYDEVQTQVHQISNNIKPDYMYAPQVKPGFMDRMQHKINQYNERTEGNYFGQPRAIFAGLFNSFKWNIQRRFISEIRFDSVTQKYVYLALHLEPEASTCVYSPYYKNQALLIEHVAQSLPSGVSLLIKENPKMLGARSLRFYKKAMNLVDTYFVDAGTLSTELVKNALAVVTITGTVAIEAALLGIPVAIFGHPPYTSVMTSIPIISNPEELPHFFSNALNCTNQPDLCLIQDEFAKFVANNIKARFIADRTEKGYAYSLYTFKIEYLEFINKVLKNEEHCMQ